MVTFRSNNSNNNRRPPFRSNNEGSKFSNNDNFQRKVPGRNNHNAVKLIEKYNDLAREASSSGDKILSENYLQHADHFTRIMNEQDALRKERFTANKVESEENSEEEKSVKKEESSKDKLVEKVKDETEVKKVAKSRPEAS